MAIRAIEDAVYLDGMEAIDMEAIAAAAAAVTSGDSTSGAATAPTPPPMAVKKENKEAVKKEKASKKPAKEAVPVLTEEEKAAKAKEKLLKTVIKEGGKKGVEIEGASDMGGLDFFCTTIESPDGDLELLQLAMTAMNAQPDPDDEERKGCSGHVGKMIFSAGTAQLAIVAYVPKNESNKSADKVDITAWANAVCTAVGGEVVTPKAPADCPAHGGHTVIAVCKSDAEKGKFALKDKDAAMAAAFAFLRECGVRLPRISQTRPQAMLHRACNHVYAHGHVRVAAGLLVALFPYSCPVHMPPHGPWPSPSPCPVLPPPLPPLGPSPFISYSSPIHLLFISYSSPIHLLAASGAEPGDICWKPIRIPYKSHVRHCCSLPS